MQTPKCAGCYSGKNLNVRPSLRQKLLSIPIQTKENLENFKMDIHILIGGFKIKRLRFYAWSDFRGEKDFDYMDAAVKAGIEVHVISKTLTMPYNEQNLIKIFNRKGIVVSLSFNKDWLKYHQRIKELLEQYKPKNVQINFTANPETEKKI